MKPIAAALALLALLAPAAARADPAAGDLEAMMREYTRLWSARDAHAIWTRLYRMDPGQGFATEADLAAEFARLTAQGYDHSDLTSVEACKLSATRGLAVLRFIRLKTDGTPMPPKDRATLYLLRRFDDGWRITQLIGMDPTAKLRCVSAGE